ncbi:MAG TPA: alpha/beta fold hydrolase [Candidatus Saccharimonadales bacterium]
MKGSNDAKNLAIVTPGRLDSKDYISLTSLVDMLADQGFLALSFDPPGTWDSPGNINLYSTTNTLKAINELIGYFGNRPTILIGHSRGGANSMLVGTVNNVVTSFVSMMSRSGPTSNDLPPKGSSEPVLSFRDLPPGSERTKQQKEFRLPLSYFEDQENYDASDGLKHCKKPKLFFYGTQDLMVPEQVGRAIFDQAAEPKSLQLVSSEHDYRLHPEIIKEVNSAIKDFIVQHKLS